jgi:hypothetical protein
MTRRRELVLILAIVGFSGTTAGASSITYKVEEVVMDGLPTGDQTTTLPNVSTGGSVSIGGFDYVNALLPAVTSSQPISGLLGFLIQGYDSSGNGVGPLVVVDGNYQGTLVIGGAPTREVASFTGTVTRLSVGGFGQPVPEALQALFNDPGLMQISSQVSVGPSGDTNESVVLTIAPATAPEPSTLVTMLSAGGLEARAINERVPQAHPAAIGPKTSSTAICQPGTAGSASAICPRAKVAV